MRRFLNSFLTHVHLTVPTVNLVTERSTKRPEIWEVLKLCLVLTKHDSTETFRLSNIDEVPFTLGVLYSRSVVRTLIGNGRVEEWGSTFNCILFGVIYLLTFLGLPIVFFS